MYSRVHVLTKTNKSLIFNEVIPKHFVIPIHRHHNKETFHISKGEGYIFMDGQLIYVRRGMKVDISPGVTHGLFTKDAPLECFVVIEGSNSDELTQLFFDLMKI